MDFGSRLGAELRGGEVFILTGDVGAGKTVLTKGIARGLGVNEDVQSPTFTISRVYDARDGLSLLHYDFYRLNEAGIMKDELREALDDDKKVVVIEWSDIVESIIPERARHISIIPVAETTRELVIDNDIPKGDIRS